MRLGIACLLTAACLMPCTARGQTFPSWPGGTKGSTLSPGTSQPPRGFVLMDPVPPAEKQTRAPQIPMNPIQRTSAQDPKADGPAPVPAPQFSEIITEDAPGQPMINNLVGWDGTRGPATYFRGSYLLWWVKKLDAPPITVVGPITAPTTVLGGGDLAFDDPLRQGGQFTIGSWLDYRQSLAGEASYFFLANRTQSASVTSTGTPLISRVFTDATTLAPGSVTLATPAAGPAVPSQAATSTIDIASRLWGADATARMELHRAGWGFIDFLGGFQFMQLDEALKVTDVVTFGPAPVATSGAVILSHDEFGTHNQFMGGELGLASEVRAGPLFIDFFGKTALGNMKQTVSIGGHTSVRAPPPPLLGNSDSPGGVLALPTNIGRYRRDQFAAIPQAGAKIGVQFNDYLRASVGYSFLYLTNVVRPGDQIDTGVNPTRIPQNFAVPAGVARPTFGFRDTDYWAQGLNFGLEVRY